MSRVCRVATRVCYHGFCCYLFALTVKIVLNEYELRWISFVYIYITYMFVLILAWNQWNPNSGLKSDVLTQSAKNMQKLFILSNTSICVRFIFFSRPQFTVSFLRYHAWDMFQSLSFFSHLHVFGAPIISYVFESVRLRI